MGGLGVVYAMKSQKRMAMFDVNGVYHLIFDCLRGYMGNEFSHQYQYKYEYQRVDNRVITSRRIIRLHIDKAFGGWSRRFSVYVDSECLVHCCVSDTQTILPHKKRPKDYQAGKFEVLEYCLSSPDVLDEIVNGFRTAMDASIIFYMGLGIS